MSKHVIPDVVHYASEYYDPSKAHEYYMRTRKLKGRPTAGMSDKQKEAWSYAKNQISTEKKQKVIVARTAKQKKIDVEQERAEATRARITEKLALLSKRLTEDTAKEKKQLEEKKKREIESLPPIPKNLPPDQRAKIAAERKQKIADIMNKTSDAKSNVSENTQRGREQISTHGKNEREKVRTELKTAISSAREEFKKIKEGLDTSYESTSQKEYDKIMKELPGKKKKSRRRKT